jgi:phosphomevalonate kinase
VSGIEVFAPGKLFVIGEYAVLHGGRALVAALDAGISCRLEDAEEWWLEAPDLGFDAALDRAEAAGGAALLAAAAQAGRREYGTSGPRRVSVRGTGPASRAKHGLGGSAASVVAVLGAFASAAGQDLGARDVRDGIFRTSLAVHRRHQRGRGSGADVAAAVYGGWLDYALAEGGARVVPAALPAEARLAAAWSGVASDTARAIDSFDAAACLAHLRSILDRFWAALERADRPAMLDAVTAYGAALAEMAGGGEGARRVADLVAAARRRGLAAKGSGAVGGDCAIVLAFDSAALPGLAREWLERGARPLAVSIDPRGVRREEAHA